MNENEKTRNGFFDFVSGVVLLIISISLLIYGIYIINTMKLGRGVEWYVSPALMPLFIGTVTGILSILLIIKNRYYIRNVAFPIGVNYSIIKNIDIKELVINYKNNNLLRLIITIIILILYIFVLIGRMPFTVATFIYLMLNMCIFRENNFSIIKIALISLLTTVAIYYGFGIVAKIPLP